MSGMGNTFPHYTQFHPKKFHLVSDGFHLVTDETIKRLGLKHFKFIKHIFGFIDDVCCMDLGY